MIYQLCFKGMEYSFTSLEIYVPKDLEKILCMIMKAL